MSNTKHLKALLIKNWILWKRSYCCSIMEILVPVIFMSFYIVMTLSSPPEIISGKSFISEALQYNSTASLPALDQMKKCSFDSSSGGYIALSPLGDSILTRLDTSL